VLARTAPATPDEVRRAERTRRAHMMMVAPGGDLLSVVISGYLSRPQVPHQFMADTLQCPPREAVRAPWAAQYPQLAVLAVYSASDTGAPFNLFGSLLAAELGFALEPLHGPVFFTRVPGPHGVVGKLAVPLKEMIAFKLITLESMAARVRAGVASEGEAQEVLARIQALLVLAHQMRQAPAPPGSAPEAARRAAPSGW
jgi:hypothetical protein